MPKSTYKLNAAARAKEQVWGIPLSNILQV